MQPTPDFKPAVAAKKLLREGRSGALATLMPGSGDPYCPVADDQIPGVSSPPSDAPSEDVTAIPEVLTDDALLNQPVRGSSSLHAASTSARRATRSKARASC